MFVRIGSKRDKHSSFLQKSVNYGQKSFIILGPEVKVIIFFFSSALTFELNKLECLPHSRLVFVSKETVGSRCGPVVK